MVSSIQRSSTPPSRASRPARRGPSGVHRLPRQRRAGLDEDPVVAADHARSDHRRTRAARPPCRRRARARPADPRGRAGTGASAGRAERPAGVECASSRLTKRLTPPSAAVFRQRRPTCSGGRSSQGASVWNCSSRLVTERRTPYSSFLPVSRTSYSMVPSHFWATSRPRSEPSTQPMRAVLLVREALDRHPVEHGEADGSAQPLAHLRHDLATAGEARRRRGEQKRRQRIAPEALDEGLQLGHGRPRQRDQPVRRGGTAHAQATV